MVHTRMFSILSFVIPLSFRLSPVCFLCCLSYIWMDWVLPTVFSMVLPPPPPRVIRLRTTMYYDTRQKNGNAKPHIKKRFIYAFAFCMHTNAPALRMKRVYTAVLSAYKVNLGEGAKYWSSNKRSKLFSERFYVGECYIPCENV